MNGSTLIYAAVIVLFSTAALIGTGCVYLDDEVGQNHWSEAESALESAAIEPSKTEAAEATEADEATETRRERRQRRWRARTVDARSAPAAIGSGYETTGGGDPLFVGYCCTREGSSWGCAGAVNGASSCINGATWFATDPR